MSFSMNHTKKLQSSFCNWMVFASQVMLSQMQQSSTCNRTRLEILSEMSFIKMRKSRGPKTDPCNTDNTAKLHEHTPSTITHCCLAERYASIHIRSALGMPRQRNFCNSNACDMESDAFFKSRNMQSTCNVVGKSWPVVYRTKNPPWYRVAMEKRILCRWFIKFV